MNHRGPYTVDDQMFKNVNNTNSVENGFSCRPNLLISRGKLTAILQKQQHIYTLENK